MGYISDKVNGHGTLNIGVQLRFPTVGAYFGQTSRVPWTLVAVVGLHPRSQRIDLMGGHELNELSRLHTAAVRSRLRQVIC
jgi:hypothetical protein